MLTKVKLLSTVLRKNANCGGLKAGTETLSRPTDLPRAMGNDNNTAGQSANSNSCYIYTDFIDTVRPL